MGTPYTLCNVYNMYNIVHNINALFAWLGGVSKYIWMKVKTKIKYNIYE